jgi:hypothetical protein
VNGVVVQVVSLLGDRGWPVDAEARIMIWAGLASLVGRLIAGYLLDRLFAPYVALVSFLVALAGLYLLASDTSPVLGMIGVGMTTGAEIDIIAYMTSRYSACGSLVNSMVICSAFFSLVQARVLCSWVPFTLGCRAMTRHSSLSALCWHSQGA